MIRAALRDLMKKKRGETLTALSNIEGRDIIITHLVVACLLSKLPVIRKTGTRARIKAARPKTAEPEQSGNERRSCEHRKGIHESAAVN